jgi:hypothetical protein
MTIRLNGCLWSAEPSYAALAAALADLTPRSRLCLLGRGDRLNGKLGGWSPESCALVLCRNGLCTVGTVCVGGGDSFATHFQAA